MDIFQSLLMTFFSFFGFATTDIPEPPLTSETLPEVHTETQDHTSPFGAQVTNDEDQDNTLTEPTAATSSPRIATALVAGGCFWCVEADLEKTPGVIAAVSGYAGGTSQNPTYTDYISDGHREVVEVTYDADKISYEDILIVTMKTTDPTDDNGTFGDRGNNYSAAFYYENNEQKNIIDTLITEVNIYGPYIAPLAIDVEPRPQFWPAEDYHQDYYKGTLSALRYKYYRNASGRNDFIARYWNDPHSPQLSWRVDSTSAGTEVQIVATDEYSIANKIMDWKNYKKPSKYILKMEMDAQAFKVTQEDGTERAGTSPLDKIYEAGIYVDVLSGEPLFSSKDKFDSGTGWPSFTRPIKSDAVIELEDRKFFSVRTEIRSRYADNHLGHVFNDGPLNDGGLRYCMNGVALRFVPRDEMEAAGYGNYLDTL